MSLHKELSFEGEICDYLAANDWQYSKSDEGYDRARALFPEDVLAWGEYHTDHSSHRHRFGQSDACVCLALQGIIGQRNLERNVYGSAQPRLNIEHVDSYLMTVPPITEQQKIVALLNSQFSKLDALTAEAERGIELLQERRTALISAAVTGKIDVRGLAETEATEG